MTQTILVIDEDLTEYGILTERLKQLSFAVHTAADAQDGLHLACSLKPNIILCEFHLFPSLQERLSETKSKYSKWIPTIVVHSDKKEEEVLFAFEQGAADYIVKPLHAREAEARIKAILRRENLTRSARSETIKLGELTIHPAQHEIELKTHKVNVLKRELEVLLLLIDRKAISREEMVNHIWGFDYYGGSRIVDVNISNLRKKIEANPRNPQYIQTIKGYGYRLGGAISKEA